MDNNKKFNPEIAKIALELTGAFFKERRQALKFTQIQLAEMAGINRTHLVNFENGKQNISMNMFFALAGCLRLKINYETQDPDSIPGFPTLSSN